MPQDPPPNLQSAQPAAPRNVQAEAQSSSPITNSNQVGTQKVPPTIYGHHLSTQDPPPAIRTRRVSIQEPPLVTSARRVSIQEPPMVTSTRRVSIQEPPMVTSTRRVSIQEPPPAISTRRVSIQEPPMVTSARRVSIQEPPPAIGARRISIQEPPPAIGARRISVQEPPLTSVRRISIPEPPTDIVAHRIGIQDPLQMIHSHWFSTQDTPQITYNRWVSARDAPPPISQHRHFSSQNSHPLSDIQSVIFDNQASVQNLTLTTQTSSPILRQNRLSVDVPPSLTSSPQASIKSIDSIVWGSQDSSKESAFISQSSQSTTDNSHQSSANGIGIDPGSCRSQNWSRRQSLLPLCWRLLHGAKRSSRQLSLVLTLAGMVIIALISLGQPWMHFQVPLMAPGGPVRPPTIPVTTIFFMRCPEMSCIQEFDQNAYLLDLSWAFLVFSSIISVCLCVALISAIFITNSNVPMLDFFFFISSILTGTSIILGTLFYLLQANEYLQEGMTYNLGVSFYLAWIGVFLFLMTGFFSYLNYVNFWSILAIQAIWT